jgi:hypothetical protein
MTDYGEPWAHTGIGGAIVDRDDEMVARGYGTWQREHRAIACVNFLAGVPDAALTGRGGDLTDLALAILRHPDDLTPAAMAADEVMARATGQEAGASPPRADLLAALRAVARQLSLVPAHVRDALSRAGVVDLVRGLGPDPAVLAAVPAEIAADDWTYWPDDAGTRCECCWDEMGGHRDGLYVLVPTHGTFRVCRKCVAAARPGARA